MQKGEGGHEGGQVMERDGVDMGTCCVWTGDGYGREGRWCQGAWVYGRLNPNGYTWAEYACCSGVAAERNNSKSFSRAKDLQATV